MERVDFELTQLALLWALDKPGNEGDIRYNIRRDVMERFDGTEWKQHFTARPSSDANAE